jgi:hypothetical protein
MTANSGCSGLYQLRKEEEKFDWILPSIKAACLVG